MRVDTPPTVGEIRHRLTISAQEPVPSVNPLLAVEVTVNLITGEHAG